MKHLEKHRRSYLVLFAALVLACAFALGGCSASPVTEDSTPEKSSDQGTDSGSEPDPGSDTDSGSGSESGPESQSAPNSNQNPGTAVAEGQAAPDFEFTKMDGTTGKLSDYRGQVVQLNFWASWCGYCVQGMPAMQAIAQSYSDHAVVLAVNRGDTTQDAEKFVAENDYDFIWALDEDGSIQKLYPARGIPYTVIIDENGIVTTIFNGGGADMYPYFEEAINLALE